MRIYCVVARRLERTRKWVEKLWAASPGFQPAASTPHCPIAPHPHCAIAPLRPCDKADLRQYRSTPVFRQKLPNPCLLFFLCPVYVQLEPPSAMPLSATKLGARHQKAVSRHLQTMTSIGGVQLSQLSIASLFRHVKRPLCCFARFRLRSLRPTSSIAMVDFAVVLFVCTHMFD